MRFKVIDGTFTLRYASDSYAAARTFHDVLRISECSLLLERSRAVSDAWDVLALEAKGERFTDAERERIETRDLGSK